MRTIASAALAMVVGGCGEERSEERTDRVVASEGVFESATESGSQERVQQRGVEMRVLSLVDLDHHVAQQLLAHASNRDVMTDEVWSHWNRWGLRWVEVPMSSIDGLVEEMVHSKAPQNRWMGEFPQWRALIRTKTLRDQMVRVAGVDGDGGDGGDEHRSLSGRPQLIARAWMAPRMHDGSVVGEIRMDVALQLNVSRSRDRNPYAPAELRSVIEEGPILDGLVMSAGFDGTSALVLVGEDPSVVWDGSTGTVVDRRASGEGQSGVGPGPRAPGVMTLGERMLSTAGSGSIADPSGYVVPKKVVLVLVPRAVSSYKLLPDVSVGSEDGNE